MSEAHNRKRLRASDADRDEVLRVLQEAHAAGRLDLEEVAERQDKVLGAKYLDEFDGVLDDLPEAQHLPARNPTGRPPVVRRSGSVPTRTDERPTLSFTVMSGREVNLDPGSPGMRDFAWWGGHDIYLADAMGPGNVVVLQLSAIMAGHDIYVPTGVRVIDESTAIMAANDIAKDAQGDGSNGTLVLRGFLFWAGNDVHLDTRGLQPGT